MVKDALFGEFSAVSEQFIEEQFAERFAEINYRNKLAEIDREWEIERRQHLLRGRHGIAHEPSAAMGITMAVLGTVFGVYWTATSLSGTAVAPDAGPISAEKLTFPLFGVAFIVTVIGYGVYVCSKARKYQEAFMAYQARRARVTPE
jgi:hypothetical protein